VGIFAEKVFLQSHRSVRRQNHVYESVNAIGVTAEAYISAAWRQGLLSFHFVCMSVLSSQQVTDNKDYLPQWTWFFHTDFVPKLLLIHPVMCVAVVALSLAILLLCFITFIVFCCPVAFVNS